jgi:hypothetical protein
VTGIPPASGTLTAIHGGKRFFDRVEPRLLESRRTPVFLEPSLVIDLVHTFLLVYLLRECSRDETVVTDDLLLGDPDSGLGEVGVNNSLGHSIRNLGIVGKLLEKTSCRPELLCVIHSS